MSLEKARAVLSAKRQREERAGVALSQSLKALSSALESYQEAENGLRAYVLQSRNKKEELYAGMLGQAFRPGDIDRVNFQVEEIDKHVEKLKGEVSTAKQEVVSAKAAADRARSAYAAEQRQTRKWTRLTDKMEKTRRRRAELAAEIALDEDVGDRHGRHNATDEGRI